MALVTPPCSEIQKPRKSAMIQKKPLMLKDYLMDDLSSCSSSGFKSFPRRQCCTTVRFLLEIDLKSSSRPQLPPPQSIHNHNNFKNQKPIKQLLRRSRSRAASSNTLSALQRASGAVINAVRNLQFHTAKSSSSTSVQSSARKGGLVLLLPRSISRRLWWKSFRTKVEEEEKDIVKWRSFRELLQEQDKPSDQTTASTKSTDSKTNSNSWGESEFSLTSESSIGNDVAEGKNSLPENKKVGGRVGVTAGEDSIETPTTTSTCSPQNAKVWLNKEEEKEQFSPVSVLDCPFEDEDDESSSSSPFRYRLARMEGTQHKLMQKIRRFENLAQLEPIDLERRMAMSETDGDDRDNRTEEKAGELVKQLIIKTSSSALSNDLVVHMKADKLVVDLFRERSVENSKENVVMGEVLKVAEEWVNGESPVLSSWEVENGRKVYVNDMDNNFFGKWMKLDEQEKEVGLELEVEVWNYLLNEFLLDLVS
ncbi:uncharacterized protein LOC133707168 [Rosa rugosa]|uniref:uncharacterized protein LOC133707168 n=1 Tax=Rosa rugosa TaxID=74645 RepID=UPI002B415340|nr:uncharacterized protein LOC133707168 [Rosa rugosa]